MSMTNDMNRAMDDIIASTDKRNKKLAEDVHQKIKTLAGKNKNSYKKFVKTSKEINKIKKEQIHYELFTASVKEVAPVSASEDFNGSAQVTVLVDDEETTITVKEDETLLDAALKDGIDAPYSCHGGVCSSCMCLVTEGEVQLLKNSILTEEEIAEGITLACQAVPKSAKISIDFDNV